MQAHYRPYNTEAENAGGTQFFPSIPLPQKLPGKPVAIADMANIFGVTHRTLHFYEEKKLLQADRIGAMRIYGPHQIRIMALINLCRETGMAIVQIQELLSELAEAASQQEANKVFHDAMLAQRRELISSESLIRRQMQQISEILDHENPDHDESNDNLASRAPFLTEFELRCLGLMSEGYTPLRISNATGRGIDDILTVENAIIRKFGSTNRFQAVAKAVLLGLIGD
ncbi:MAG: LuxR family transcriptional regulator [Rhizobium sp.]|nr:LuxR family transcriptional regulator [Rhizobium sp.]